ncbi:GcrA family cell cycle regulator [Nisaea sediminum]|uniref:GcrA family cell cycle regulator n=1 Tax=Nisaea sediminum TaxID=2775867 RepID=UPI001867439B|nr:GcrA family cell cycle regulator [Nisaea sediminum]
MTAAAKNIWTPDKVEGLRQLVTEGKLPAARIAGRLGLTRNQVIGKIHRTPDLKKAFSASRGIAAPPCRHEAVSTKVEHGPGHLSRLGRNQCRWPLWIERTDAEFMHFCGHKTMAGKPYCNAHQARASGGFSNWMPS